jgi:hypothetical protein
MLHGNHFVRGANAFLARDRSAARPHLLIVDRDVPQPDGAWPALSH